MQALVQNTGDELAYKQGDPVQAHLPAEALRVLTDTGVALAPLDEEAVAPQLGPRGWPTSRRWAYAATARSPWSSCSASTS